MNRQILNDLGTVGRILEQRKQIPAVIRASVLVLIALRDATSAETKNVRISPHLPDVFT